MARASDIEWTEATWNPITGCTKVSPGRKHCYAERMAERLRAMGQANYRNGSTLTLQPHMLKLPLSWKKPQTVFVNSMSDLFHKDVPVEYVRAVFDVMNQAHWPRFGNCGQGERLYFVEGILCQLEDRGATLDSLSGFGLPSRRRWPTDDASLPLVLDFYTLSMAGVPAMQLAPVVEGGLPRYDLPVALNGRLAIDERAQRRGFGEKLLMDAFRRVMDGAGILGCVGVFIDAKDEASDRFYRAYGFVTILVEEWPRRMFLALGTLRDALEGGRIGKCAGSRIARASDTSMHEAAFLGGCNMGHTKKRGGPPRVRLGGRNQQFRFAMRT